MKNEYEYAMSKKAKIALSATAVPAVLAILSGFYLPELLVVTLLLIVLIGVTSWLWFQRQDGTILRESFIMSLPFDLSKGILYMTWIERMNVGEAASVAGMSLKATIAEHAWLTSQFRSWIRNKGK